MGLDIGVGLLSRWEREVDPEELATLQEPYTLLNAALAEADLPAHHEPGVPEEAVFEAQMWGYSGLHTVRRLAAYHALKGRLPTLEERAVKPNEDGVLEALFKAHLEYLSRSKRRGSFVDFMKKRRPKPRYEHLLCHSDCEGFYIPQSFVDVVFDQSEPQRAGLGGMIGPSAQLLGECRELAALIRLPAGLDPESEEIWEAAEEPKNDGELWEQFGVEAFCLSRLIRGCETSLKLRAALIFT